MKQSESGWMRYTNP
ncbi:Protein of unknown function [Bacillus mycoides]|nr:Protein of unknown function [Bacillus mycoides]